MPEFVSTSNTFHLDQEDIELMMTATEGTDGALLSENTTIEESDSDSGDHAAKRKRYTSTDWDRSGEDVNEEMMFRSVSKAGLWAYGISGVEVWVFNEENNNLERPAGGFWRDPVFESSEALERLEDTTRVDYVPPKSLGPGEGLAGALWAEVRDPRSFLSVVSDAFGKKSSTRQITQGGGGNDIENNMQNVDRAQSMRNLNEDFVKVSWRSVDLLAADPDQPPSERLRLLSEAGFGLAAGATFDVRGHRGIVVYMARPTVDVKKLQSITNEVYMRSAADLIGAESALSKARSASIETRKAERKAAFRRCKLKLKLFSMAQRQPQGEDVDPFIEVLQAKLEDIKEQTEMLGPEAPDVAPAAPSASDKVKIWAKKSTGMHVNPPPPMPIPQAMWTFVGCFITMAILITTFKEIARISNGQYKVPLPIYASLMTLHYGLTASPAGQPRNMLYGKFYGMSVALILGYFTNGALAPWIHLSLVTAIVVSGMMLLSITHPPAASVAIIFASGGRTWVDLGLVLMADCIAVGMSIIINNISSKRQYPVYWGFLQWELWECLPCARTKQIDGVAPVVKKNAKIT